MIRFFLLAFFSIYIYADVFVAAAANITYPLNELKEEFKKYHPNIKLLINTGASGSFHAQIKQGVKYDIYMSANLDFAKDLESVSNNKAQVYAQGMLMLFNPKKTASLDDLNNAKCIAIANPKSAPYGLASIEVLDNLKIDYKKSLVKASSIANTLSQILKACDMGFIAASSYDELMKQGFSKENLLLIDERLYSPILQGMILLSNNEEAKIFYDFLTSENAKRIFNKYGYK